MTVGRMRAALTAVIISIFLFPSCDEMDLTLPISRNYHVSARGEDHSLDDFAILKINEKIQPFFVSPINNDPDVTGLTVSVMPIDFGNPVATIHYILESMSESEEITEDEIEEEFRIIKLRRIDGSLPSFSMPSDLEAGPYIMAFQVFGRNQNLLSRSEKNFYYIAEDDYSITDISVHLPGLLSAPVHLIPPETVVLLEAGVTAGMSLDPYIVWYNGRTVIGEGKVSDGANSFIWQVPSQTGFQSIRAEVIPFPPIPDSFLAVSNSERVLRGRAREISLPISPRGESQGDLPELLAMIESLDGQILWNYHPAADLNDQLNPLPRSTLLAWNPDPEDEDTKAPHWISAREGFGLGIGPENIYTLPSFSPEPGSRISFVLRLVSLNEGDHFSVSFYPDDVGFVFSREEETFTLIFYEDEEEERIPVEIPLKEDYLTLFLDFSFLEEGLLLSLKENGDTAPKAEKFFDQWDGDRLTFQLGGWSNQSLPVLVLGELCVASFPADPLPDEVAPAEEILLAGTL